MHNMTFLTRFENYTKGPIKHYFFPFFPKEKKRKGRETMAPVDPHSYTDGDTPLVTHVALTLFLDFATCSLQDRKSVV